METNELYIATMYAKNKDFTKIIRMFLATPIKKQSIFSSEPIIIGFKEAITDTLLTKRFSNRDIDDNNVIWNISNKKAINILPESEIRNYLNISEEDMKELLELSKETADQIINAYTKKRTK